MAGTVFQYLCMALLVLSTFTNYLKTLRAWLVNFTVLYNVPTCSPESSFKTSPKGLAKTDAVTFHRYELFWEKAFGKPFLSAARTESNLKIEFMAQRMSYHKSQ